MRHRNLELDRLRAFAVLMTLYIHLTRMFLPWATTPEYRPTGSVLDLWSNCWTGVDLFFVISGYIISSTVVEKFDAYRGQPRQLATCVMDFFKRRIYRIYPVAWTVWLGVLFASVFFNDGGHFGTPRNTVEAGMSIFTYTFNYFLAGGHYPSIPVAAYWSLAVEEQFYLVFPFILICTKNTRQRALFLGAALLLITFVLRPLAGDDSHALRTQNRCDGLLYGCLLYLMTTQPWFEAIRLARRPRRPWTGAFVLGLVLILGGISAIGFDTVMVVPLAGVLSSVLVFVAACEADVINFAAPLRAMLDYFGSRSYSLYIVHFPMLALTQELMQRYAASHSMHIDSQWLPQYVITGLGLSLAATEILYRGVEQPFIRRGKLAAAGSGAPRPVPSAGGPQSAQPVESLGHSSS